MKRGKDDENKIGPMFPRLHVNDTDKRGPRAPPRNKMALYEQLSIPSQRFNSGVLPLNPSKASNLFPAGSSSQGNGFERNLPVPVRASPTPSYLDGKLHSCQHDGGNSNASSAQLEQRKKLGDEDDFTVPVFVDSGMDQCLHKNQNGIDREMLSPFSQNYSGSRKIQNAGNTYKINNSFRDPNLRQDLRNDSEENLQVCVSSRDNSARPSMNLPTRESITRPGDASLDQQIQGHLRANFNKLSESDACLLQNGSAHSEDVPELTTETEKGNIPRPRSDSHSKEVLNSPNEPEIDSESCGDKTCRSLQLGNGDKSDGVSETSMVDSISALDISPDDIVGIIGQKRFWKARRAIVNQQRLFAWQVFELHRLTKVQQLIAASPNLLLQDIAYLGKHSSKVSPAKKLPSEYVVAPPVHLAKRKGDSEKPNHKMECSAENAVGKTSLSSVKSGSQTSNYGSCTGNPLPVPVSTDPKVGPWCFNHSFGHQWLIPVMSPSEGLVYKPYTAPGFTGSACGGCAPLGPTPLNGSFMNPAYGIPASHHHHQGTGVLPFVPPGVHGYFPPYGMPAVNPGISCSAAEQMNYFAGSGVYAQTGQSPGGGGNLNLRHQSSCNVPTQKSTPQDTKFQACKDMELQGSTASSPSEKTRGVGTGQAAEGRNAVPPFPVAPACPQGVSVPQESDQPRRVIKVVPHNPRSATESAARIFQSIQEERKQHDST